jgi:hypothetical protein
MRNINNKLRKNYRILSALILMENQKTTWAKLLQGFDFEFLPIFYKPKQVTPIIYMIKATCFRQRLICL